MVIFRQMQRHSERIGCEMNSRASYRKFVEELRGLVHEFVTEDLSAEQVRNHLNAMRVLLRKLSEESKAKPNDLAEAREVIGQVEGILALASEDEVEYCFVMVHPKFGEIGADGPWCASLGRVRDKLRHVDRSKYVNVFILKRSASTKEVLGHVDLRD